MIAPADWTAYQLVDLLKFSNGINADKAAYGRGTRFVNVLEVITNESLMAQDIPGRVSLPDKVLARYLVKRGDVLFNRTSETQDEVGLSSIYLDDELVVFGGFVFRGHPKTGDMDVGYAKYGLRAGDVRRQIVARGQGGIRANIGQRDLNTVVVRLPELPEQRAIAHTIDHVSSLARAIDALIVKKRAIKQGMIKDLLSGRTRLPGFVDEWQPSMIGTMARVIGGGTPSTRVPAFWDGPIPWLTPGEISSEGAGLLGRSERSITARGLAESGANMLPAGTVLVTSRASIGNCAVADVPLTTNQGFASMIPSDPRSTWFLYYWVQENRRELESRAAGSTFLEISAGKVASIALDMPSLPEQEMIGQVLRDVDLEMDVLRRRKNKVEAIKTGMMQTLLTGRVRLVVEATS